MKICPTIILASIVIPFYSAFGAAVLAPRLCPEIDTIQAHFQARSTEVSHSITREKNIETQLAEICKKIENAPDNLQREKSRSEFLKEIVAYRKLVQDNDVAIIQLLRDTRVASEGIRRGNFKCAAEYSAAERNMITNLDAHGGIEDGYAVSGCKGDGELLRYKDLRENKLLQGVNSLP